MVIFASRSDFKALVASSKNSVLADQQWWLEEASRLPQQGPLPRTSAPRLLAHDLFHHLFALASLEASLPMHWSLQPSQPLKKNSTHFALHQTLLG